MANPIADFVVSLGIDGRVVSQGTLSTALKLNKALSAEVKNLIEKGEDTIDAKIPTPSDHKAAGKLIVAEEISEGRVSWDACQFFLALPYIS
jgi:hypothetical protein